MRTFHLVEARSTTSVAGVLAACLIALAIAAPARAAAQEGTSPEITADSVHGDEVPTSVWNAHRVARVLGDGTHVVLGDGTIWEIYLPDRPSVNTWRPGDLLVVKERSLAQGEFDYSLIDGRTRGAVAARLVGAAPRRS